MGKILNQRLKDNGIVAQVLLSREEARELGGEMDDVLLFTEQRARTPARISLRGKHEATKYFLIPRALRRSLNAMGSVSVQRIQRGDKDIFVYVVGKDGERRSYMAAE